MPAFLPAPPALHQKARAVTHAPRCAAEHTPSVVVIGGGAAGHLAAITCARLAPHARVALLEAAAAPLAKVRASGGGRCNVTTAVPVADDPAAHYPRGAALMRGVLAAHGPSATQRFFRRAGVPLKREREKIFPVSDDSGDVVAALVAAARDARVDARVNSRVVGLTCAQSARDARHTFVVDVAPRAAAPAYHIDADFVVVATGSARAAWNWAARLGHAVVPPVPSLFSFGLDDARLTGLAGVSVADAQIELCVDDDADGEAAPARPPKKRRRKRRPEHGLVQRGPVLVTHWGLSGPAVLALSAFGARALHERRYRCRAVVDWTPGDGSVGDTRDALAAARRGQLASRRVVGAAPVSGVPKRLWASLARGALSQVLGGGGGGGGGADALCWGEASNAAVAALADALRRCEISVRSKGEFKDEFVTAGGVALSDVHGSTLQSRLVDGLYFAGETLDVDGRTGGFNLEFAWSSGFVVGRAVAQRLNEDAALQ